MSISSQYTFGLDLEPSTSAALMRFARRRRWLLSLRTIAVGIVVLVLTMVVVAICDYLWLIDDSVRWMLSLVGYAVTFAAMWWLGLRHFGNNDLRWIARQLESADPRLREDLLSAVELADPLWANGAEGFRRRLQRSVARRVSSINYAQLLPVRLVRRWLTAGAMVVLVCTLLMLTPEMQFGRRIARAMLPGFAIQRASLTEIMIVQPSPASGYVAAGDAVGVVVQLGGAATDQVQLQWRTSDGTQSSTPMTPRLQPSSAVATGTPPDQPHQDQPLFAANLAVGSTPLQYRVLAGDAITLWNTLTPLPRPRVESFHKQYQFPAYAKLADRVEQAEHGDLQALVGTTAVVTVRFDQPVDQATLRFSSRGATYELDRVEGSDRDYRTTIPIKTPAQYQVDAVSARSGLNNPFSPHHTITPVIDTPPMVQWAPQTLESTIVSPLDVVAMSATAVDDLPLDTVWHEFQINSEPFVQRVVPIDQSDRELQLNWDWDLMHRLDDTAESIALSAGDIVRCRVVAVDRRGQRGESSFIELLVVEPGFDRDRHQRLHQVSAVSAAIAQWSQQVNELLQSLREPVESGEQSTVQQAQEQITTLHEAAPGLISQLRPVMASSGWEGDAAALELIGRGVLDLDAKLAEWSDGVQPAMQGAQAETEKQQQQLRKDSANQAQRHSQSAARLEQYARANFAQLLSMAVIDDAQALHRSLDRLRGDDTQIPIDRFGRHLLVAAGRLQALDQLIDAQQAVIPETTARHFADNFQNWSDSWDVRFSDAAKEPPREEELKRLIEQFSAELQDKITHAMLDGRIAATLNGTLHELHVQVGGIGDRVLELSRTGVAAQQGAEKADRETDSEKVAAATRQHQLQQSRYTAMRESLLARIESEEQLHRSRPRVDLQYAADLNLMHRAITNVTQAGFEPYQEEPAQSVHDKLGRAFQWIEGRHESEMWLWQLQSLRDAERRVDATAAAKVQNPLTIERYNSGMQWPLAVLRNVGLDGDQVTAIDRTRNSDDYRQARDWLVKRRWSGEPFVPADAPVDRIQQALAAALATWEPRVTEARATIQQYVLSLPQQARQAAEAARQAEKRTSERPDSEKETADDLAQQQAEVAQQTQQTLEALVDFANTADLADAQQRELARDADAATAQIQQALQTAQQAMQDAAGAADEQREQALDQSATALSELSQALEQTAEHFERAENGDDLAETRGQLRAAETTAEMSQQLQQRYERAQAMAEATQRSPAELMQQLEQQLQRSEPMQQELSEISERAAEAAQRTLQQAAQDERALNQSLQRGDASFAEQKQQAARQLSALARQASTVDQALLSAAERAVGWANTPEARPKLEQAREQLRQSVDLANQMGGDQALLDEIKSTAANMASSLAEASKLLEDVEAVSGQASEDNIHKDSSSRSRTRQDVERFQRDARQKRIRDMRSVKNDWSNAARDAGRRVEAAARQQRDAQRAQQSLQQQIKKDEKKRDQLQPQIDQLQQRIDDAQRAEQAAKQTSEFANQQAQASETAARQLEQQRVEPLEKLNPAAQLAQAMAAEAGAEIEQLNQQLQQLSGRLQIDDQLQAKSDTAQQLASDQRRIQQAIQTAAQQLQRASRHEQRLGAEQLSQQLEQTGDAVADGPAQSAQQAAEKLDSAASDAGQAAQADQQMAQTTQQINEAAQQLAELLAAAGAKSDSPATGSTTTPSDQRAQQLAQTLDELDRAMTSQQQADQNQPTDAANSPQDPSAGQSGEASSQQPGEAGSRPGSQSAGEASPTLAGAMEAQNQSAARQRQQRLNPRSEGSGQPGQQGESNSTAASPTSESGAGQMPDGGAIDTADIERLGTEWGQLRQRRTDDAIEGPAASVAPQYRREIEAYFRAVARKAGEAVQ